MTISMGGIVSGLIVGMLVGAATAWFVMPGRGRLQSLRTVLVAMMGALVGTILAAALGIAAAAEVGWPEALLVVIQLGCAGLAVSVLGAARLRR